MGEAKSTLVVLILDPIYKSALLIKTKKKDKIKRITAKKLFVFFDRVKILLFIIGN
tara:strand:- start:1733 stop:1900 length:168 start_codon:yes stop_codon:yes gene_type:complete